MRKVHVNYNDGNQISLVQQRSMRPREKFEIKKPVRAPKDNPLAFGLLKKKIALWLRGNRCSDLLTAVERKKKKGERERLRNVKGLKTI